MRNTPGPCGCRWDNGEFIVEFDDLEACPLHAAAPDLLAALDALCDAPLPNMYDDRWTAANAAIAKAKGEA